MEDSKETQKQQPPHGTPTGSYDRNDAALLDLSQLRQPPQPLGLGGSPSSVGNEQQRRRGRGRPRKYADLSDGANANSSDPPAKRLRGRPPGSVNKKNLHALGGAESSFTPHIIHVNAGEEIASKVVAFMSQEPRDFCILSASGAVSTAMLHVNNPRGPVKFEGIYDIIAMSGSFLNTESNGTVTRAGSFTVTLARADGRLVGGTVAGMLVAASPVQVIVGCFVRERVNVGNHSEPPSVSVSVSGTSSTFKRVIREKW